MEPETRQRVALVTGAGGGGIGSSTALTLARSGFLTILHGSVIEPLLALGDTIASFGGKWDCAVGDVSNSAAVSGIMSEILEKHGAIDVLVCNAARGNPRSKPEDISDEAWARELDNVLSSAFFCARSVIPGMRKQRFGRIIFVSSSAAVRGSWGRAASYAAAKAGLLGLTKQLAMELGPEGILVNAIAPSQIDTPRVRTGGRRTDASLAEYGKQFVPLKRAGTSLEVAGLIDFLASPQAGYVTGQVISIDGGASLAYATTRPKV